MRAALLALVVATTTFTGVTVLPPAARAAGKAKPLPGAEHDPPVFLDETSSLVTLITRGSQGYAVRASIRMNGFMAKADTVRLEWKQGGKVLVTAKCRLDYNLKRHRAWGDCQNDDTPLKVKGPIEADLIYWDDHTEKDYLVRTFKVNVKTWTEIGNNVTLFQVVPDDVLGAAYARIGYTNAQGTELQPEFVFWATTKNYDRNPVMRCTVDGKKLDDFDTAFEVVHGAEQVEADHTPKSGPHVLYRWEHLSMTPKSLYIGPKDVVEKQYKGDGVRFMIDNPGKWDCQVRLGGKAIRNLLFTVNENGTIDQDEMQTGAHPIPTLPGIVLIDVRIPKDNGFDTRVRPDAMKKSMGFGLPWPEHAKVKAIHAALPPASGLPDP